MPARTTSTRRTSAAGATGSRSRARVAPVVRFRMRISAGDAIAIGPGKVALLEAIGETGSLTAAARSLDMSYRRAWLLLADINRSLRQPAVDSAIGGQHGGGSQLTPVGRRLIDLYRGIEATAEQACAADIREMLSLLAR